MLGHCMISASMLSYLCLYYLTLWPLKAIRIECINVFSPPKESKCPKDLFYLGFFKKYNQFISLINVLTFPISTIIFLSVCFRVLSSLFLQPIRRKAMSSDMLNKFLLARVKTPAARVNIPATKSNRKFV